MKIFTKNQLTKTNLRGITCCSGFRKKAKIAGESTGHYIMWDTFIGMESQQMEARKLIKLTALEDAQEFVTAAAECDFDIDMRFNKVIVDAKSFLGVLSLLSHPVMIFSQGSSSEFERLLEKYAVA